MALRIPTSIKFGPFAYSRVAYDTFRLAQETARSAFVYAMTSFVQDLDPLLSITCIAGEQRVLIISNTNNESARNFAKGDVSYSFQTHSIESLFLQLCFVDGKLCVGALLLWSGKRSYHIICPFIGRWVNLHPPQSPFWLAVTFSRFSFQIPADKTKSVVCGTNWRLRGRPTRRATRLRNSIRVLNEAT